MLQKIVSFIHANRALAGIQVALRFASSVSVCARDWFVWMCVCAGAVCMHVLTSTTVGPRWPQSLHATALLCQLARARNRKVWRLDSRTTQMNRRCSFHISRERTFWLTHAW
jgi:hypothetical protein